MNGILTLQGGNELKQLLVWFVEPSLLLRKLETEVGSCVHLK